MSHEHYHELSGKKLFITILLNLFITILQVIGGFAAKSLSLLSDAMHNFSDVLALVISYIAHMLTKKDFSPRKTFGYKRAEIMAALINAVSLLIIAFFLIKESIGRLSNPITVDSFWVIILAGLSIIINTASVLLLQNDSKKNINIKSAYIHLLTDVLTSVAVLAGGIAIYYFHVYLVDSVLSLLISLFLIYSSLKILGKTIEVLMQFAPTGIDVREIEKELLQMYEIKNIHHIHLWQLNDNEVHLEAHIDFNKNLNLRHSTEVINRISSTLKEKFNISHTVLQQEYGIKDDKSLVVKRQC